MMLLPLYSTLLRKGEDMARKGIVPIANLDRRAPEATASGRCKDWSKG